MDSCFGLDQDLGVSDTTELSFLIFVWLHSIELIDSNL